MLKVMQFLLVLISAVMLNVVAAEEQGAALKGVGDRIQSLKKEVMELSRELSLLEEELLYPSSTQLVVFVSMDPNSEWKPDSLRLEMNGQTLASHIYTKREARVMSEGGVQRLYQGNVREGEYKLTIVVQGKSPEGREAYTQRAELEFEKDSTPSIFVIRLSEGDDGMAISTEEWN